MKVTKRIEEYVRERIEDRYKAKRDEAVNAYNDFLKQRSQLLEDAKEVAFAYIMDNKKDLYTEEFLRTIKEDMRIDFHKPYFLKDKLVSEAHTDIDKINALIDRKTKEILFALELGGKKEDIETMINELEV